MNLTYWGFRYWPFERTCVAERFFAGSTQEEAIARLLFLVEESRRCGIVVGPSGSGKTLLLNIVSHRAERIGRLAIRCNTMASDGNELTEQFAKALQVPCDSSSNVAKIWNGLHSRLAGFALVQQPVVIIIDHNDLARSDLQYVLSRIHQISDAVGLKLTSLLTTRDPNVAQSLNDHVELRVDLIPWSVEETSHFVRDALGRAGCDQVLFTDEAINAIHFGAKGIPLATTTICHFSLIATMGQNAKLVTREIVEAIVSELVPKKPSRYGMTKKYIPETTPASTTAASRLNGIG